MTTYPITLTSEEMEVAAHEGTRRCLRNKARNSPSVRGGFKTPNKKPPEVWKCDIEGAAAELAVARLTNRHWAAINQEGKADVGRRGGVRHTAYSNGHLIIHDDDADDINMVLVTGTPPNLVVHGWIPCGVAKLPKYHRKGRPKTEFWVPQAELRPLFAAKKKEAAA